MTTLLAKPKVGREPLNDTPADERLWYVAIERRTDFGRIFTAHDFDTWAKAMSFALDQWLS